MPEPEGAREGKVGNGPLVRILVVGDSAAAGVGVQTQAEALSGNLLAILQRDFCVQWKLIAHTGATTTDSITELNASPAKSFDFAVTSLGVNDVTSQQTLQQWKRDQRQLISLLETRFRVQHIFVSGLPPMHRFPALPQPLRWYLGNRARQFDHALAELAAENPRCEIVRASFSELDVGTMAVDGFHPGPDIYREWARELARRINALLGKSAPADRRTVPD